jgi:hypothetical protein
MARTVPIGTINRKKRCSKLESEKRVAIILKLIIGGASPFYVHQYVNQKTDWDISSRQVDKYIARARKKLLDDLDDDLDKLRAEQSERLDDLYRKAYAVQEYKTCLNISAEKNKLFGLHAPAKHDVTSKGESIKGFTVSIEEGDYDEDES